MLKYVMLASHPELGRPTIVNVNVMKHICCRPFVCLSVCLSSVTFVRPTQATEIFGNVSTLFGTLATHPLTSTENLRRSSQGNLSVGGD